MEKNSPVLTDLKSDFYNSLTIYLQELDKRLEGESSDQKQLLLKDEINNTKKIATNIYEQREKKILLAAVSKARGGNPDTKNMIKVEKELFDSILGLMNKTRGSFLKNEKKTKNIPEDVKTLPDEKKDEKKNNLNPIVRVTDNIPEFVGTDEKKYNLRKNDIVSLPDDMSNMLSKRGVVKKIER
jgi:DNA replication initiation complex subunit (GINS family)